MARKKPHNKQQPEKLPAPTKEQRPFRFEFKNPAQKMAWGTLTQHDVSFLLGPAGTGKTMLACAYAISEILEDRREKIILTRPVVEAGEHLGFLPGSKEEKLAPYMAPMFDCMELLGRTGPQREKISKSIEIAPVAYLRGRTFHNAVCIFDEAQNATEMQLKLFLTRLGENSKIIITGDPMQSDLRYHERALMSVVERLEDLAGIGIITFKSGSIVRHPLIASMLERLEVKEEDASSPERR